jgi:hypothetical protein
VASQGSILATKWVMCFIEGSSPWQMLLHHTFYYAQHVLKVKGSFNLCDIISAPHLFTTLQSFIYKSIWDAWKILPNLSSGISQVVDQAGI